MNRPHASMLEFTEVACVPHKVLAVIVCFVSPSSLQESEISTRRKECEALEAEVKRKNQTCQTLVSAPKIHPRPLSERTEAKIDLYLIVLSAVITHKGLLGKRVAVSCHDSLFFSADDWNWEMGGVKWEVKYVRNESMGGNRNISKQEISLQAANRSKRASILCWCLLSTQNNIFINRIFRLSMMVTSVKGQTHVIQIWGVRVVFVGILLTVAQKCQSACCSGPGEPRTESTET